MTAVQTRAELDALPHGTIVVRILEPTGGMAIMQRSGRCWLDIGCSDPVRAHDLDDWIGAVVVDVATVRRMAYAGQQERDYVATITELRARGWL